jgi:hypothetical protein
MQEENLVEEVIKFLEVYIELVLLLLTRFLQKWKPGFIEIEKYFINLILLENLILIYKFFEILKKLEQL